MVTNKIGSRKGNTFLHYSVSITLNIFLRVKWEQESAIGFGNINIFQYLENVVYQFPSDTEWFWNYLLQ